MDMATIGDILRKRIRECGFTQKEFADKACIGKATLTKQMNGTIAYRYDDLIKYAELLDCSYDYLLGYTKSPDREVADIVDKTGLSKDAIKKLESMNKKAQSEYFQANNLKLLSCIICDDDFLKDMTNYLGFNKRIRNMNNMVMQAVIMSMPKEQADEAKEYLSLNSDKLWLMPFSQDIERINKKMRDEMLDDMRDDIDLIEANLEAILAQAVVKANE